MMKHFAKDLFLMKSPSLSLIKKIINTRSRLIAVNKSYRNNKVCSDTIKGIKANIEAYKYRWNESDWNTYLRRKKNIIRYLIPANDAEESFIKQLNELTK